MLSIMCPAMYRRRHRIGKFDRISPKHGVVVTFYVGDVVLCVHIYPCLFCSAASLPAACSWNVMVRTVAILASRAAYLPISFWREGCSGGLGNGNMILDDK